MDVLAGPGAAAAAAAAASVVDGLYLCLSIDYTRTSIIIQESKLT